MKDELSVRFIFFVNLSLLLPDNTRLTGCLPQGVLVVATSATHSGEFQIDYRIAFGIKVRSRNKELSPRLFLSLDVIRTDRQLFRAKDHRYSPFVR